MIGLIYKDFCVMKKAILTNATLILIQSLLFLIPWTKIMGVTEENNTITMGITYAILPIFAFICISIAIGNIESQLMTHDENIYYSCFVTSTPLSVKGQVLSKYYETLILSFSMVVWGYICNNIINLVNGVQGDIMVYVIILFFLQILMKAIEIPFLIRYGSKSGTMVKIISGLVIVYFGIIYFLFGPLPKDDLDTLMDKAFDFFINEKNVSHLTLGFFSLAPYVIMLIYYISYKLSCKWYLKGVDAYE